MKKSSPSGTNIGFGIRREILTILRNTLTSRRSGLAGEVCHGRANGSFMLAAWMMFKVSPSLSGNFNVFDYAGNFPRWEGDLPGFSRKGLRDRIRWADKRAIMIQKPEFVFNYESNFPDFTKTTPLNASKDKQIRPWDIPLIAWEDQMVIPYHWNSLPGQIHREATYSMDVEFVRESLPYLLGEGRLLRLVLHERREMKRYLAEAPRVWGRLKDALLHQHKETRRHYQASLMEFDQAMRGSLREEAKVAFLAFSVADFRPKNLPERKRQDTRQFT